MPLIIIVSRRRWRRCHRRGAGHAGPALANPVSRTRVLLEKAANGGRRRAAVGGHVGIRCPGDIRSVCPPTTWGGRDLLAF